MKPNPTPPAQIGHTPTPKTDAAIVESILCTEGGPEECTVFPVVEHVEADFARALEISNAELVASLEQALRYVERVTAHRGAMDAKQLEAEEKHVREYVSTVETGRWVGDTVKFDLFAARAALAKAKGGAS